MAAYPLPGCLAIHPFLSVHPSSTLAICYCAVAIVYSTNTMYCMWKQQKAKSIINLYIFRVALAHSSHNANFVIITIYADSVCSTHFEPHSHLQDKSKILGRAEEEIQTGQA